MKHLSLTALLLTAHLPLYLMDDNEDIFDAKGVKMIARCTNKCAQEEIISSSAYDPRLKACNDICITLYKYKIKEKLQKEQTQTFLARIQARQEKKD